MIGNNRSIGGGGGGFLTHAMKKIGSNSNNHQSDLETIEHEWERIT